MEFLVGFLVLAIVICVVSIWHASTTFHKVYYRLSSEKISKPVKFVLLSDLHDKSFGKQNEKIIKAVLEEQPDAVLIAGDILTASLDREDAVAETLCKTLAKYFPIYYGLGNHEAKMKWSSEYYQDAYERYTDILKEAGITVLLDDFTTLSDTSIRIYGLDMERKYYKRINRTPMEETYLLHKLGDKNEQYYNIVLAHNPEYFDTYINWKPELVLSGHLHGGLVRLPFFGGVIAPSLKLFPKYDGGKYEVGQSTMIISRGLGSHHIGFRMWNPAEVVVITLSPTKE